MKIVFVGYGRAGKDEAAHYLSKLTTLRYAGSFSWAALPHMASLLGEHPQYAWDHRHENRQLWKYELDRLRLIDQCYLARLVLQQGDVTAGIRDKAELDAVKAEKLFDHIVWVSRPGTPIDSTVTFGSEDCDWVLHNNGPLKDFWAALRRVALDLRLPLR